ncbi:MAG TPA: hypothetical protein VHO01_15600 [Jatrophihabitans sp.]|nr:hypothetical protein [Jatrophihabitans sp.]
MSKKVHARWQESPAAHDFPAAESFLRLLAEPVEAAAMSAALAESPTVRQRAKDLLRAARLGLLAEDDPEVAKELKRIARGVRLSPILAVRGRLIDGAPLVIADGYHRICASYHVDEDTEIPCRLITAPPPA